MSEGQNQGPDFIGLYERYQKLKPGPQAELKRVVQPDDLLEIPAFYRLLIDANVSKGIQRLVYCLPLIKHAEGGDSLGRTLAKADVNEKRLFMVIRSQEPNDLIQLRRLLKQIEPKMDWLSAARIVYYWNDRAKRQLLEDFFFYQNTKTKESA
ncbi:type I-E CRISPR-associated protein Cse2/CasB [Methylomonas sp. MK1]|jgi:CRISPR system Cascade subunit CasB|uniref:type I-E CRISPR-associated protein Cse2/CasB n=1 Tax=Methylomonas sp. MK1 TaxID=1131552 RepID=UPI000370B83E|nr:type I-E CRISPR-associated protein Cse2/CasB [Methylomonas sp. MK1]